MWALSLYDKGAGITGEGLNPGAFSHTERGVLPPKVRETMQLEAVIRFGMTIQAINQWIKTLI